MDPLNPAARSWVDAPSTPLGGAAPMALRPAESLPVRLGKAALALAVFLTGHGVLKIGGINLTVAETGGHSFARLLADPNIRRLWTSQACTGAGES